MRKKDYPEHIKALLAKIDSGQNVTHRQRVTLVTYLLKRRLPIKKIVGLLSDLPDFNEAMTFYQVKMLKKFLRG